MKLRDLLKSPIKTPITHPPTTLGSSDYSDISYVFAIGEVDGQILSMYDKIFQKEKELGIIADWIISPGSLGVWPDYKYVDYATRRHTDAGDFLKLYYERWIAPRNTLFISGPHDDNLWLDRKKSDNQLLGNFWYLPNGITTCIGPTVTGLGKVYSPKVYKGEKHPKYHRYYTRREVEKACSVGPSDILLTHQGPNGEVFGRKKSNSEGIKSILYATRPKVYIHSGYRFSKRYECLSVPCISLDKMEIAVLKWYHSTKEIVFL